MIYIYTYREDQTANSIMDWLAKYNIPCRRVNSDSFYSFYDLELSEKKTDDVHWFWKWRMPDFRENAYYEDEINNKAVNKAMTSEYKDLFSAYFDNIQGEIINHPHYVDIDKLSQLRIASQCGLIVPATIVTSQKSSLLSFFSKHKQIITKNLIASVLLEFDDVYYQSLTSLVSKEFIDKQPDCFFPSLFQETIEKEFELRVIYIGGQFFSCAIVNVDDSVTDSREAVNSREAQLIPYKLPAEIECKLHDFMQRTNLQIGSIDMIYNENGYVFLEVNPSGQMLGYSEACNYNIEKTIAQYLINESNGENKES
ncbi:hypothetical protein LJC16_00050 [Bacteroidales bacterium OttesenSCG-928-C19]|nr:hypothetical protein [Bacteroidales bacterium OttesenSCG-928-C19]